MKLSYYEVYIESLRAFTALGFPYGLNEDAANIITWLELNNLDGVKKLSKFVKNININYKKKVSFSRHNSFQIINLNKSSLLYNGPGLMDFLCEKADEKKFLEVYIKNCFEPIYLIPIVKKISNKFNFIKICWIEANKKKVCVKISNNKIEICNFNSRLNINTKDVYMQISLQKESVMKLKTKIKITKVEKKIDSKKEQIQLENALNPKKKDWEVISKMAKKTFVPASSESRKKGAGGGDDND